MHACGHDGHSATLVAAAAALRAVEDRLPVCVKLVWQPAEEGGGGAQRLVEAGLLDGRLGPKVSAIFGLHGWPGLKVGFVASKPGPLLAATDNFSVTFVGKGCHGAFPHLGRDPIVAASEAVVSLQQCASRDFDPTEPVVVTVGIFQAGTAVNVIPDVATIQGTARTLTDAARKQVAAAIERRCAGVAAACGCQMRFTWADGYPPTLNDPNMTAYLAKSAQAALGNDRYIPVGRPSMGGEDFAYTWKKSPAASSSSVSSRTTARVIPPYTATNTISLTPPLPSAPGFFWS
jgi:amidohydrolase